MEINANAFLTPDYMRESNNFIMDYNFMENQIVFPKNHFFEFNKPDENGVNASSIRPISSSNQLPNTIDGSVPEIPLEEVDYAKQYGMERMVDGTQTCNTEVINSVQSYSAISLGAPDVISEPVIAADDVVSLRFARKALPHKKRISRKLKSITSEPQQEQRHPFTCEICGHCAASQLDFFSHLKDHYEPTAPNIIASLRTTLEELETEENCIAKKQTVEQVFNDVHLHFADFSNDGNASSSNSNNIKLFNPSITKCIDFDNTEENTLKNIVNDEIEFSDTEDMLEGIRNVVDKVSVEDSCEEIDLIASNELREHWFNNNHYQRIPTSPLKSDVVSFPNSLVQILSTTNLTVQEAPNVISKESDATHLLDFSSLCAEKFESANIHHPADNNAQLNHPPDINAQQNHPPDNTAQPIHPPDNNTTQQNNVLLIHNHNDQENCSGIEDALSSIDDLTDCQTSSVNNKLKQKTSRAKEKHYFCEECKREFNSANALKYHRRTHTGIRPHKCSFKLCERSFFSLSQKIAHERTHTGEKPFKCEICEQKFRQWADLKYHTTSIHTDEKNHQCEFCGKAFSRKYSLVIHIRIHENVRNYKCDFCDKAFRASSYLQNHRRIHTGERPHECKICNKRFRVYGDLRRHLRVHLKRK